MKHALLDPDGKMLSAALSALEGLKPLRKAAFDCGTDSDNPDTCGVCHKHFADCEMERMTHDDDLPFDRAKTFPACPGARVRAALIGVPRV